MGYKLNTALKKSKTSIIIALVLWVIVTVILVSPFSYTLGKSMANGKFDLSIFLEQLGPAMTSFTTLFKIFQKDMQNILVNLKNIFRNILGNYCNRNT